ncbi:hypothetical protein QNH14_14360 [Apirhabdus apintestini]|nr:hypothetical protein QNH14_14360 [Enterobacteriaceae bacterium CA-0114]
MAIAGKRLCFFAVILAAESASLYFLYQPVGFDFYFVARAAPLLAL